MPGEDAELELTFNHPTGRKYDLATVTGTRDGVRPLCDGTLSRAELSTAIGRARGPYTVRGAPGLASLQDPDGYRAS